MCVCVWYQYVCIYLYVSRHVYACMFVTRQWTARVDHGLPFCTTQCDKKRTLVVFDFNRKRCNDDSYFREVRRSLAIEILRVLYFHTERTSNVRLETSSALLTNTKSDFAWQHLATSHLWISVATHFAAKRLVLLSQDRTEPEWEQKALKISRFGVISDVCTFLSVHV